MDPRDRRISKRIGHEWHFHALWPLGGKFPSALASECWQYHWDLGETEGRSAKEGQPTRINIRGARGKFWVDSLLCWLEPSPLVRYDCISQNDSSDYAPLSVLYSKSEVLLRTVCGFKHCELIIPQLVSYSPSALKIIILLILVVSQIWLFGWIVFAACIPSLVNVLYCHDFKRQEKARYAANTLK